jgi:hypothetical protein
MSFPSPRLITRQQAAQHTNNHALGCSETCRLGVPSDLNDETTVYLFIYLLTYLFIYFLLEVYLMMLSITGYKLRTNLKSYPGS